MKALACLVLAAGPAAAADYVGFLSPIGNIHCAIHAWAGGAEACCDLAELTPCYRKRPAGCDLEWRSLPIGARGASGLKCHGDTVLDRHSPVLGYGVAVSVGGISCVSARTGMTCTNA